MRFGLGFGIDAARRPSFIRSLFTSGEQGAWYDPSDFSTLFQDSAGTTPVTALGQGVGLMLDKRFGLVLGSEQFSDASVILGGESSRVSTGVYRIYSSAGAFSAATQAGFTTGKTYRVTFTVDSITTTGAGIVIDWTSAQSVTTTGVKTFTIVASSGSFSIKRVSSACDFQISNVSVRELPGNHAYQTTAASRPTVQSPYISFDKTDDHFTAAAGGAGTTGILLAVGIMVPAAGTARTIWSDRGTNTGYRLSIDTANKVTFSGGTGAGYTTLTSAGALTAGTKYILMAWHDGTNLNLSINNVAETPVALGTVTAGTASFTVGKDNGAASGYWGDRLYQMVYRKNDASNATQRNAVYSFILAKMGGL